MWAPKAGGVGKIAYFDRPEVSGLEEALPPAPMSLRHAGPRLRRCTFINNVGG